MTLQELIAQLAAADQTLVCPIGFGFPHSYRGDYAQLGFPPVNHVRVSDMLRHATEALDKKFSGYKGGVYISKLHTDVYLAERGECGEEIGPLFLKLLLDAGRPAVEPINPHKVAFERIVDELTPAWEYVQTHRDEFSASVGDSKTKIVASEFLSSRLAPSFDLVAHLKQQSVFSLETFGPGPRVNMVLDHARKEIVEIAKNPTDVSEWIDLALLAFDGAWRAGFSPVAIVDALSEKLAKNMSRTWPDWREQDSNKAIEHTPDDSEAGIAEPMTYPEKMTASIRAVLGRPNFTCMRTAHLLRLSGVEIEHRSEAEQAAVIHFLLKLVLRHGEMWIEVAEEELMAIRHAALKAKGVPS